MGDMDVIRFVAVDIITNAAYHAPPRNQSYFSTHVRGLDGAGLLRRAAVYS